MGLVGCCLLELDIVVIFQKMEILCVHSKITKQHRLHGNRDLVFTTWPGLSPGLGCDSRRGCQTPVCLTLEWLTEVKDWRLGESTWHWAMSILETDCLRSCDPGHRRLRMLRWTHATIVWKLLLLWITRGDNEIGTSSLRFFAVIVTSNLSHLCCHIEPVSCLTWQRPFPPVTSVYKDNASRARLGSFFWLISRNSRNCPKRSTTLPLNQCLLWWRAKRVLCYSQESLLTKTTLGSLSTHE